MNRIFKNLLIGLGVATAALLAPTRGLAQSEPQPAVVISIAELNRQLAMVEHMLTASGFPELKFIVQSTVKQYTKGVDLKKASGVMLYFQEDKDEPDFLAYFPVVNLEDLLDTVAGFVTVDEDGDNTRITMDDGKEFVLKKVGDVAFLTNQESMLENIPQDPASMLEELPAKYNLATRIYGQRIPESLRNQWLETIRDGYESQMEAMGEDSPQADIQEMNWKQIESMFKDTESITIGMVADKEAKHLAWDIEVLHTSGSEMAKKINNSVLKENSKFKGFLMEGAAMSAHGSSAIAKEDLEQSLKMIEKMPGMVREQLEDEDLSDEEIETLEALATDCIKVVTDTLNAGKIDGGAVMMLEESDLNFAAGFFIAKPSDLEDIVKKYVPILEQKMDSKLQVELNSGNHKDVTFHRVTFDVTDEEAAKVLGEQAQVIIGIGKESGYLAFGNNPLDLIKKAMDSPGPSENQHAFQVNFQIGQFLKFANQANEDPMLKAMSKKLLANGNDRVRVTSNYIQNGYNARMEVQDGILSLIKVAQEGFSGGGLEDEEDFEDDDF